MTMDFKKSVTCGICGAVSEHRSLVSANTFGSPDLDTRPAPMMRETIDTRVQECPDCGLCSADLSVPGPIKKQWLSLLHYRTQLEDGSNPRLVNRFLCSSILLELSEEYADAAWQAIHAAWACDDAGQYESSRGCRTIAIGLLKLAKKHKQKIADEAEDSRLIEMDLLRRASKFGLVKSRASRLKGKLSNELKESIVAYQKHLATAKDDSCHTIEEAEDYFASNCSLQAASTDCDENADDHNPDIRIWQPHPQTAYDGSNDGQYEQVSDDDIPFPLAQKRSEAEVIRKPCVKCGREIGQIRLEIYPETALCQRCSGNNTPDRNVNMLQPATSPRQQPPSSHVDRNTESNGLLAKFQKEVSQIELRNDLSHAQKVSRITHMACAACAGVAIQPIPFADIFVLTPMQAYFASRIAAIHGVPVSKGDAEDWVKEIISIVGMGLIAQQLAIGVWKLVSFGMGGLLTIPLVYGLTYAIMKVADAYFAAKSRNERISDERLKEIWRNAMKEGKKQGKSYDRDRQR